LTIREINVELKNIAKVKLIAKVTTENNMEAAEKFETHKMFKKFLKL